MYSAHVFSMLLSIVVALSACNRAPEGSPEAVADGFVDAYFRRADQEAAKAYTALGASRMLDKEMADVRGVRDSGYLPTDASIDVAVERAERSMRGERVRFHYTVKFKDRKGEVVKHADVELAKLDDSWKVVRVGLSDKPPPTSE